MNSNAVPDTSTSHDGDWDPARLAAAMRTLSSLQTQLAQMRQTLPDLVTPLQDDSHKTPAALYVAFERGASDAVGAIKHLRETWGSEEVKTVLERAKVRDDVDEGWELVVGRPRWVVDDWEELADAQVAEVNGQDAESGQAGLESKAKI